MDPRNKTLASNLVNISVKAKKGDKLLIVGSGADSYELAADIVEAAYAAGAYPYVWLKDNTVLRSLLLGASADQLKIEADNKLAFMKQMDCYISIWGDDNQFELSDVPYEKTRIYNEAMDEMSLERVSNTKWCVLAYPNASASQGAKMSKSAFADYYYKVCCLDYAKMDRAMEPLKLLMEKTDRVRLTGVNTDLSFSIKGLPAVKCAGEYNIPDGEIYTAPVRDSVNGIITFNTPSLNEGTTFEDICFEFKQGKIVKATSNHTEKLNKILDTDEGARYIGEFSFGVNPYITSPMLNTLFDEKIAGSFHFTPGSAYDDCDNSNRSIIHWDLVFMQTEQYGGGEIYFDDVLIRKNGRFVLKELEGLNPENLI